LNSCAGRTLGDFEGRRECTYGFGVDIGLERCGHGKKDRLLDVALDISQGVL
jgi:hypothetical protein